MRIVFWGTYDKGKPRVRIVLRGLKENGVEIIECQSNVWQGVEDKWALQNWRKKIALVWSWLASYPRLIIKYLSLPQHDAIFVGYMGHLDVIIIWPLAKLRGVPIIWDAFISLYNTIVEDRELIRKRNPLSFFLYAWEWFACRLSDLVILDTNAHIGYFCQKYFLSSNKFARVFVGAEKEYFSPDPKFNKANWQSNQLKVLFYGQFIPLHGIEYIITAARILEERNIEFILIGKGQEEAKISQMLKATPLPGVRWIPWVSYENLCEWINKADICLGIFGNSQKACQVIPNKVFQIIVCGKPLITRDSPAIRELLSPERNGVYLIPPAQPEILAKAILEMAKNIKITSQYPLHQDLIDTITSKAIGKSLLDIIKLFIENKKKGISYAN